MRFSGKFGKDAVTGSSVDLLPAVTIHSVDFQENPYLRQNHLARS